MRFYIVDDDINIVKILENIINDKNLGTVIGYSYDGDTALKEILEYKPDIVLIDYLMPKKDGVSVIKSIRDKSSNIYFIIISQVSDKEMIADSYSSGIEFFINKPINIIEVENVVKSVTEKIKLARTITDIQGMLQSHVYYRSEERSIQQQLNNIKIMLSHIGILGEKGSYDIIDLCKYLIENEEDEGPIDIKKACRQLNKPPKTTVQRMRRSIYQGMINIAYNGIEDYMNENFIRYSNSLFDFENVKCEMDYIRGKRKESGKVSVVKFIENILFQSKLEILEKNKYDSKF